MLLFYQRRKRVSIFPRGKGHPGTCQPQPVSACHWAPPSGKPRQIFLHVIAGSKATGQSVTPQKVAAQSPASGNCLAQACQVYGCHCEERSDGTIRFSAEVHNKEQYFRRNGKWCGFSTGRRFLQTLTGCKLQHVIARSGATWQSVLLAVAQSKKQYFGQIRKA